MSGKGQPPKYPNICPQHGTARLRSCACCNALRERKRFHENKLQLGNPRILSAIHRWKTPATIAKELDNEELNSTASDLSRAFP